MANPKCKLCNTTVYPVEAIKALDATWHLKCLKCGTCGTRLSLTTLHSFDRQPFCRSHVPSVKHTTVADDVSTQHAKDAQAKASYANRNNVETQKGTGEKPTQVADDVLLQHAKDAQSKASYAKSENVATQKGAI
eukprot:TRINITY_DN1502_c0_g1_i6.p1 TRINITY_DN1502_c0_g1~~TRINITY_DN1502_c0_g1_i6.p1  ORF type:complete len:135 (-),score=15.20 TRINITY_DN1502_c0_g1_i6:241-645(-)